MNKQKYLAELSGLLSSYGEDERSKVMDWCAQRFDKAGAEGEAELMAELGTPMRFVISLNRRGLDEVIKPLEAEETAEAEEAPAVEEIAEAEEAPAVEETAEAEEAPAVEETAEAEGTPVAEETAEADETENMNTTELVAAVLAEPEEEEEKPAPEEESSVTDEIEELELPAEENKAESLHSEAFPELSHVRGEEPPKEEEPEKKLSVLGTIGFFILMIVPGLPLLALSIVLIPALLAPVVMLGYAGAVGVVAGIKTIAYIPDAMFVFGITLLIIGIAILVLLFCTWIIGLILKGWFKGVPALFRRMARKEKA